MIPKRALVTGGTRGIGYEIVKMLTSHNYEVTFIGRTHESVNNALETYNHSNIKGIVYDMSTSTTLQIPFNFDTVIHNAGMLSRDSLENINENKLHKMFAINAMSPIMLTKMCLPYMMHNNSGNVFFFCPPYQIDAKTRVLTPYMQSKLAQTTFMASIADLLSNTNIKVGGFWTKYPIYTDALIHRNIGKVENCMSPKIIAKTVELMMHDKRENVHGNVILDGDYLLANGLNPNQWALGSHTKSLEELFSL